MQIEMPMHLINEITKGIFYALPFGISQQIKE